MPSNSEQPVIISDTSCLIGLTNIGHLDILRQLYGTVIITSEIADEYGEPLPDWVAVKSVQNAEKTAAYNNFIDLGEASAIALAAEFAGALLILDDRDARQFATGLGFKITGTLGVLIRAYQQGIIFDLAKTVSCLQENGFRLPTDIGKLLGT